MCCAELLTKQRIAGVAATDPHVHVNLDPVPESAATARQFVLQHAAPVAQEPVDLMLLTSELITNGVLHARTPLTLGVSLGVERVLVSVADRAPEHPVPRPQDTGRTTGRGIVLVDSIACQWGVAQLDRGKVVWFTLPAATDQPS